MLNPFCAIELAASALVQSDGTFVALNWHLVTESYAGWRPRLSKIGAFVDASRIDVHGHVTFAANPFGGRVIELRAMNTHTKATRHLGQLRFDTFDKGYPADLPFSFYKKPLFSGEDFVYLRVNQSSGSLLSVIGGEMLVESVLPKQYLGRPRVLVFQGVWDDLMASLGGFDAMVDRAAGYELISISHAVSIGSAIPWKGTKPVRSDGVIIQDYGWPGHKDFVAAYKSKRPDGSVFEYVSAAIDAPNWDMGGNPIAPVLHTDLVNLRQWKDEIDKLNMNIDGFYPDHGYFQFIGPETRDKMMQILRHSPGRRNRIMPNMTVASVEALQFMTESPYTEPGDYLLAEGFVLDNGNDVSPSSNLLLAEARKYDSRDIRLALICEQASGVPISQSNVAHLNALSLYNSMAKDGDAYGHSRIDYDVMPQRP